MTGNPDCLLGARIVSSHTWTYHPPTARTTAPTSPRTRDDYGRNQTYDSGPDIPISERRMLLSVVLLWLCATLTMTGAEAFSPWGLPLAFFRHISQLEGGSSWLSRLGWGLGEAEVSIVVSGSHHGTWAAYFARYKLHSILEVGLDRRAASRGGLSYSRAAKITLLGPGKTHRSTLKLPLLNILPLR